VKGVYGNSQLLTIASGHLIKGGTLKCHEIEQYIETIFAYRGP